MRGSTSYNSRFIAFAHPASRKSVPLECISVDRHSNLVSLTQLDTVTGIAVTRQSALTSRFNRNGKTVKKPACKGRGERFLNLAKLNAVLVGVNRRLRGLALSLDWYVMWKVRVWHRKFKAERKMWALSDRQLSKSQNDIWQQIRFLEVGYREVKRPVPSPSARMFPCPSARFLRLSSDKMHASPCFNTVPWWYVMRCGTNLLQQRQASKTVFKGFMSIFKAMPLTRAHSSYFQICI